MTKKKCFLCKKSDSVIDFNDKSFKNCYLKLLFRQSKGFKYGNVKLTKDQTQFIGYHSACYKNITVLKKIYHDDFDVFVKNLEEHPSFSTADKYPNDSTSNPTTTVEKESSGDLETPPENVNKGLSTDTVSSTQQQHSNCTWPTPATPVTPVIPADPMTPVISVDPVRPVIPVTPVDPMMPIIPVDPMTPVTPIIPADPMTSVISVDPMTPVTPIDPMTSVNPVDSMTPVTPVIPVAPMKPVICLFCNCKQRRCGNTLLNLIYPQGNQTIQYLQGIADQLHDLDIIQKLKNQTVAYHKPCYVTYQTNFKRSTEEQADSSLKRYRQLHKVAFESLCNFIDIEIFKNNHVMYFAQIFKRYQALLLEFGENTLTLDDFKAYRSEILEKKLLKKYGDQIFIEASTGPRNQKIIYKADIEVSIMANNIQSLHQSNEKKIEDVAYKLRNSIKQINPNPLPKRVTADDVIRGECEIPDELFNFMLNLINGPDIANQDSTENELKIKSICSDIIYIVSKGRCKPAKNITLGLAIKSLTNSRQVITILNRYGHTIGYTLAEELETEMTYTSFEDNNIIPTGISKTNGCSTHVAFDNFDRFIDTSSGKDTMHDTVGIIYQFPCAKATDVETEASSTSPLDHHCAETADMEAASASTSLLDHDRSKQGPSRKRRRFDGVLRDVRPYFTKPKTAMQLLPVDSFKSRIDVCKGATEIAMEKDFLWIMSLSQLDFVPMWLGYNCMISADQSEIQKIEYLPQINLSPTSYAIVYETLKMSSEIAEKCHQKQIIVTYDLAIAKMAMQIQEKEKPKFDHIFINLGAFHMQMAFFKAIGKFIESSGLIEVLVSAEALAAGSANSFLDSKHFNRCKRLHPLTSAALQILHFKRYLSTTNVSVEMLNELLRIILEETSDQAQSDVNERIELPDLLNRIVNGYKEFCRQTLEGNHGKTAQFYYQYCEFINLFLRFSRSIRASNFELYLDSIFNMCDLFFALNQPNYARWSLLYLNNLVMLQMENSPLVSEFRRGAFGVRRTKAKFARSPVDLTLEQTINADASNQLSDNFAADSISARQRWALSHSMRTKILSCIKDNVGLTHKDDTSHSLQKSFIKKDQKSLQSIVEVIQNTMNPFEDNIDKTILFNISTGKAASDDVTNFLLNIKSIGSQQKLNFINQCSSESGRFEKPITRNKILNFASQCTTKELTNKDKSKKVLLKMERDIFGRLLAVSIDKKINIEHCLTFPLAPMPPALFSCSGEMFKTDKSTLAKTLKSQVEMVEPTNINVEIIDGFYYLYLIGSTLPQTFAKIAEYILIKLCMSSADEIHLIFDRYFSPSIKDSERQNRQEFDIPFKISGPQQTRPTDFLKSLKNYRFKEALIEFLSNYWENDYLKDLINDKKIFLTVKEHCYSYKTQQNRVIKNKENDYECFHEEADTRMVFHAYKATAGSRILIKSADTDVLIILLGNMHKIKDSQIWLASSLMKKKSGNDLNCINCTELASKLGSDLCLGLPAFHAYTGSDYTAAFYNKGKIRPFKLFSKNQKYQQYFALLTDDTDIFIDEKMNVIQEFTVAMYGIKNCNKVNDARYKIFVKKISAKEDNENFLKKVRSFDSNTIPPCWESLKQKILRTIYVNSMWLHATESNCVKLNPENCGWYLDGYLKPKGFDGDQTPLKIEDILQMTEKDNEEVSSDLENDTTSGDSDPE